MNIVIVDYGAGNLASIKNILKKAGIQSTISSDFKVIEDADKLILPGVGAFDTCVQKLNDSGLIAVLNKKVLVEKTPLLGICVGLQLLFASSEEGKLPGLNWIEGKNVKFKSSEHTGLIKVPHMGWSEVYINKPSKLFEDMYEEPRFYFVHSYHPQVEQKNDILIHANYGYEFVAGVEHANIAGVQFHPEKSHKFGMRLLENFVKKF